MKFIKSYSKDYEFNGRNYRCIYVSFLDDDNFVKNAKYVGTDDLSLFNFGDDIKIIYTMDRKGRAVVKTIE